MNISRQDWAFEEMEIRRAEDARFPQAPHPYSDEWDAYAMQRRCRALRRKARGYSRKTADDLVAWAQAQEVRIAA